MLSRLFGSFNDRVLKKYHKSIPKVRGYEKQYGSLSDDQLRSQLQKWREKYADSAEKMHDITLRALGLVCVACERSLGLKPFDVQIIGALALNDGSIAEMKTGEGKTLVAAMAATINAISGNGVHIVTVNDYLANRDRDWMNTLYAFLNITSGCIISKKSESERRKAYACDITYGTNNEIGFDYLRDNMKFKSENLVMRPFNFAVIDEVDSILIDEARTPLIISGPSNADISLYPRVYKVIHILNSGTDYDVDEENNQAFFTDTGYENLETHLKSRGLLRSGSLFDIENMKILNHSQSCLRAKTLMKHNRDYLVKDNRVMIVDEFTGRVMEGRRYSDGLHQAIEAKEGVQIQQENQTLASITFQNFFRLYPKIAGMTGTAATEAAEFEEIYKLKVISIPPNQVVNRKDYDDEIYQSIQEKEAAIITQISNCNARKQPVLVGTVSIDKSEKLSRKLRDNGISHQVLNAKNHAKEAEIISQAGVLGAVTIATNMAGRGTDIKLGGSIDTLLQGVDDPIEIQQTKQQHEVDKQQVISAGGLFVIGTERHESRRVDNQLRGRSGRQGDIGASKFFLSMEDDLLRVFGSDKIAPLLQTLGLKNGEVIKHPWLSRSIERAQRKVEARNFEMRKNLLKFDDVLNSQRQEVYNERHIIMASEDETDRIAYIIEQAIDNIAETHFGEDASVEPEPHLVDAFASDILATVNVDLNSSSMVKQLVEGEISTDAVMIEVKSLCQQRYEGLVKKHGQDVLAKAGKAVLLQVLDQTWKDHLLNLDNLRQNINLRSYGQKDPLMEYKQEALQAFNHMLTRFNEMVALTMSHLHIQTK
jgi:preprotein translocase subunit SecA